MGVVSGIPSPCPRTDSHSSHYWTAEETDNYIFHCLGTTNHDGWSYHNTKEGNDGAKNMLQKPSY